MLTKKFAKLFCIVILLLFIVTVPQKVFASNILFQDNFDDGNADGWEEHLGVGGSWVVQNGEYIGRVNRGSPTSTYALAGDANWTNYTYELKVKGTDGVDKKVKFRYKNDNEFYELNLRSNPFNDLAVGRVGPNGWLQIVPIPNTQGVWYELKIVVDGNKIQIYIDGSLLFDFTDTNDPILNGKIGLEVWPGITASITRNAFDNITVTSIDEIPTFPYFSQGQDPWGIDEYDNAINQSWADPPYTKMADLGCLVTSAAMVLRANGVTTTPGNPEKGLPPKELDPGTLNEWLISVEDGDFRNGITNLGSIARMTNLVNTTIDSNSPKLEWNYSGDTSENKINSVLTDYKYVIPKIYYLPSSSDMHFLVISGKQGNDYEIKDPISESRTLFSDYYNQIDQLNWFSETSSDFSYLIFAIDETADIHLTDENDNEVGDVFIQHPIANLGTNTDSNAPSLKMLFFQKPPTGTYTLTISAGENQQYQLDTYIYDVNGDGGLQTTTGVVGPDDTDTYTISLDHESADDSTVDQPATFESLRNDLNTAYELGWITNRGIYKTFLSLVNVAEKIADKGFNSVAVRILTILSKLLDRFNGRFVTQEGYDLLTPQIDSLINSL